LHGALLCPRRLRRAGIRLNRTSARKVCVKLPYLPRVAFGWSVSCCLPPRNISANGQNRTIKRNDNLTTTNCGCPHKLNQEWLVDGLAMSVTEAASRFFRVRQAWLKAGTNPAWMKSSEVILPNPAAKLTLFKSGGEARCDGIVATKLFVRNRRSPLMLSKNQT